MQVQRSHAPVNPPSAPPRTVAAGPEPVAAAPKSTPNSDQLTRQSVPPEHSLATLATQAEVQATALEQAFKNSQRGNVVSRTLNTVVGKVSGHSAETQAKVTAAITAYRALPQKIEQLREDLKKAEKDPAATERLLNHFRSELQQVETLAKTAETQLGATQSSQKFWSGLTAEITSTLLVTGAAALATRKLGLPLNAATATAGFVLGGSTNVATHALFDSQYDLKREGLGNFLTAGISSSAMVITAKPGTSSLKRMMATQAVVASASAGAGAVAREYEQGFQAGWQKRVASGTLVGAGVGVLTGAAGTVIAGVLPQSSNALVQKGIQATAGAATGTVGAGVAGTLNEAFNGFSEGWQARVGQQMLGTGHRTFERLRA